MIRIKVLVGYAAQARFFAEGVSEDPIGTMPRQKQIPRPYSFGPEENVFQYGDRLIILCETGHRQLEVYDVTGDEGIVYGTQD